MSKPIEEAGDCTRKAITIDGENFYVIVGDDFAQVTVPRENDPLISGTRKVAERVCDTITELMIQRRAAA